MSIQLFCPTGSFRGNMIAVSAELAGVKVEWVHTDMSTIKTPEFLKKNPLGKVPVIITPEGPIFESSAILRHIARVSGKLYGATAYESSLVDQYLDMNTTELLPALTTILYSIFGFRPVDKEVIKTAKTEALAVLKILNERVKTNKFLAGATLTIADIQLATFLNLAFRVTLAGNDRKALKDLVEYFLRVAVLPEFIKYNGRPHFATSEFASPAASEDKKEKKEFVKSAPKTDAPKKDAPKKDAPKKEAPKKEEKVEKEEEEVSTGPAKWNLYDFKTLYTNAKNKEDAITDLVANFKEGEYCLYYIHYQKYEGEGKIVYQFNNMKNGFIQRCDPARKKAFGTYSIYGDEPNLELSGVWLFQGATIPVEMNENPSFEYHDLKKLDISKPEDLNIVRQYWNNTVEDESVAEGLTLRSFGAFK